MAARKDGIFKIKNQIKMTNKLKVSIAFVLSLNMLITFILVNSYESTTKTIIDNQNEILKRLNSIEQKQMGKIGNDEHLALSLDGVHFHYEYWKYFKIVKR